MGHTECKDQLAQKKCNGKGHVAKNDDEATKKHHELEINYHGFISYQVEIECPFSCKLNDPLEREGSTVQKYTFVDWCNHLKTHERQEKDMTERERTERMKKENDSIKSIETRLIKQAQELTSLVSLIDTLSTQVNSITTHLTELEEGIVKKQFPQGTEAPERNNQELVSSDKEKDKKIAELEESLKDAKETMRRYELRFQILETTSYDGTLLWKIAHYKSRKEDAKNKKTLSLYGQPFFTTRHTYRMCPRVYLNGDGNGENTHLSLFFVVMRGENDALLKWPFELDVSLMVLSQVNETKHVVEKFRPLPSSSSFQRPTSDMNLGAGCTKMISHEKLEATNSPYLKDDTIFLKIVVDTTKLKAL